MTAAVVLPEERMEKRLSRSRVSHIKRIAANDNSVLNKIFFSQYINSLLPYIRGDIAGFQLAEKHVDKYAVACLYRYLCKILMRAVHRVPRLECCNSLPSLINKKLSGFKWGKINARILLWECPLA